MMMVLFWSGFWPSVQGVLSQCIHVRHFYENSYFLAPVMWEQGSSGMPNHLLGLTFFCIHRCVCPQGCIAELLFFSHACGSLVTCGAFLSPVRTNTFSALILCPFLFSQRYKLHTIKFTILKYNSVVLICATITTNSRISPSPRNETYALAVTSHSCPQPLATTNLSVSGFAYSGHFIYGLLCLSSFTQHSAFMGHPCCSMYHISTLFSFMAE